MKPLLGLFDSGLGGLTVLRRVLERHGAVSCIYLGDTARVPYGGRDVQELRQIAAEVVGWLRDQQVSTVVIGSQRVAKGGNGCHQVATGLK